MDARELYLINYNTEFLVKRTDKYFLGLSLEDLKVLNLSDLSFTKRGTMDEDNQIHYEIYSGTSSTKVTGEGYEWIDKSQLLDEPLRQGDKFYIKHILDGHKDFDLVIIYREDRLMTAYDRGRYNQFSAFFKHLHTINHHRRLVRHGCFKVGLYWQGLTHDLSKYSPSEFFVGVKYYQGTRSPNVAERSEKGYSTAWLHHKGRNRHHQEYWTDYSVETGNLLDFKEMPPRYFIESIMDRVAACKVYRGKAYNDGAALDYLLTRDSNRNMNKKNYDDMVFLFTMLRDKGEKETYRYIKKIFLKGKR